MNFLKKRQVLEYICKKDLACLTQCLIPSPRTLENYYSKVK